MTGKCLTKVKRPVFGGWSVIALMKKSRELSKRPISVQLNQLFLFAKPQILAKNVLQVETVENAHGRCSVNDLNCLSHMLWVKAPTEYMLVWSFHRQKRILVSMAFSSLLRMYLWIYIFEPHPYLCPSSGSCFKGKKYVKGWVRQKDTSFEPTRIFDSIIFYSSGIALHFIHCKPVVADGGCRGQMSKLPSLDLKERKQLKCRRAIRKRSG